jgi:hypothetical protein
MLSALRRVLKEARRLKLMDADDYDSAVDFKGIKSTQLLRGRALSEAEISALLSVCMDDPTPKVCGCSNDFYLDGRAATLVKW